MKRSTPLPRWCKDAKKEMIEKDMEAIDLAEQIGVTRQSITAVINGRAKSDLITTKISKILNIEKPTESTIWGK